MTGPQDSGRLTSGARREGIPEEPKRALVTGASSGIGREFAIRLAHCGYAITAVARREQRLSDLVAALPGNNHRYVVADLASPAALEALTEELSTHRYHLLVNNAGYSHFQPFYQSDLETQQKILAVNCGAAVTLAHAFLRQARAGDALINLASIVSYLPTPAQPLYSASKAFIAAFSQCLWAEHRERDVYVMALCPGVTRTEFILGATGGTADDQALPDLFVQNTQQVVREALKALARRDRATVVTGRINRLLMQLPRLLSRHRLLKLLTVVGDPNRALTTQRTRRR